VDSNIVTDHGSGSTDSGEVFSELSSTLLDKVFEVICVLFQFCCHLFALGTGQRGRGE
jgi:hypothetical protein